MNKRPGYAIDPVHKKDGKWWFWTETWADEIGADAFGADALDSRRKIDSLLDYGGDLE